MSDVTDLKAEVLLLRQENKELRDKNKALRKLASDMWEAIKTHKRINFAQLLRFGERLHKLGVIA